MKDRIGVSMIETAERDGPIEPGRTMIGEVSSSNTGIGVGFVCAAKGQPLRTFLPQSMSCELEALLRMYGARVVAAESMGGIHEEVDDASANG